MAACDPEVIKWKKTNKSGACAPSNASAPTPHSGRRRRGHIAERMPNGGNPCLTVPARSSRQLSSCSRARVEMGACTTPRCAQ